MAGRPVRTRSRSVWGQIYKQRAAYLFILPAFLSVAVFLYWPTFTGFYYAFTDWNPGLRNHNFIGFANFAEMARDPNIHTAFRNVLIIVAATLIKDLTVPLLAAQLVFNLKLLRLQYWLRTMFVIPIVMPAIAIILLWVQIYDPNVGLLNQTLGAIGLGDWQRAWLGDGNIAIWAIVGVGFPWIGVLPFLVFLGGLMAIPRDLFDAATVDGASFRQRFLQIDLPMLTGQIRLIVVLGVIEGFQVFYYILVMTGGGPFRSTTVPGLEMYYAAFQSSRYGYACAIAVVLFAIIMTVTIISLTKFRSPVEHQA